MGARQSSERDSAESTTGHRVDSVAAAQYVILAHGGGAGNLIVRCEVTISNKVVSVEEADLRLALDLIRERHAHLQMQPRRVRKVVELIPCGDPLALEVHATNADEEYRRLLALDFRAGPQASASWLAGEDGCSATFLLCIAHLISDARSGIMLAREFLEILDTILERKGQGQPMPSNLDDLGAGWEAQPLPQGLRERAPRRYSRLVPAMFALLGQAPKLAKAANGRLTLANSNPEREPLAFEEVQTQFTRRSIQGETLKALITACKAHGTTVHAAISASTNAALLQYLIANRGLAEGRRVSVPTGATCDLRTHEANPSATMDLSYMAGPLMLAVTAVPSDILSPDTAPLWEHALSIKEGNDRFLAAGYPWRILRLMNSVSPFSMEKAFNKLMRKGGSPTVMNAGRIPSPSLKHLELNDAAYMISAGGSFISVCVTTLESTMVLNFACGSGRISDDILLAFADNVTYHLERLAKEYSGTESNK